MKEPVSTDCKIAPLSVIQPCSYDFDSLFIDACKFEEKHNANSMAILGDCLTVLKGMKSNSVNLIFADAPYNIGKDFDKIVYTG